MPTYLTNSNQTTTQTMTNGEQLTLTPLGNIFAQGTGIAASNDGRITVSGGVYSGSNTIDQSSTVADGVLEILVTRTGSLLANNVAIYAFDSSNERISVTNAGQIISASTPFYLMADTIDIVNTGEIHGGGSPYSGALWLTDTRVYEAAAPAGRITVQNTGTISAINTEVNPYATIYAWSAAEFVFNNSGNILSDQNAVAFTDIDTARINNSGLIDGLLRAEVGSDTVILNNTGTIGADDTGRSLWIESVSALINNAGTLTGSAVFNANTAAGFTNTGQILGDVEFGNQGDIYLSSGTGIVTGTVYGGGGADLLRGGELDDRFDGGDGNDTLRGAGGDDDLYGNNNDDRMFGGDGNDTMNGGNGADTIIGDAGDDQLLGRAGDDFGRGGDGNDLIYAGANNDWFYGGFGNDTLYGEGGDDRLYGDAGDDEIDGGAGRDVIYTGDGLDVIIFNDAADSAVGAQRDVIYDFEQGSDLIDVTGVVGGLFSFVGTGAFTGTANEIRLIESGGSTRVQMDTDADGTVDSEIFLKGAVGLTADDFLL